jgi:enoyl-CoA hydratase/carnithine racemase
LNLLDDKNMDKIECFQQQMHISARHADGKLIAGRIGRIGVILLNNPEKRNAICLDMWQGISESLDLFSNDPEIRVLIYAGAGGRAFTAGADISEFATKRDSAEANQEYTRIISRGRLSMERFPKPSIACIEGYCIGGGMNLAMQTDLRVAAPNAIFGIPAARMGIAYPLEHMERLVSLVGPGRAKMMLLSARKFTAEEALQMGLIEMVAKTDVKKESLELAESIAENAPLSVSAARFAVEELAKDEQQRNKAEMAHRIHQCLESKDYREAREAFKAKRSPAFIGA